MLIAAWQKR